MVCFRWGGRHAGAATAREGLLRTNVFGAALLCGVVIRISLAVDPVAHEVPAGAAPSAEHLEFFEARVRPVLVEHCQRCHGAAEHESGLRLDSREAALAGGAMGAAVVPGRASKSRLISAIRRDGDLAMPPDEALSAEQIADLVRWVELGAPWPADSSPPSKSAAEDHWAFQPIREPALPEVVQADWCRTPVDRFILARLEASALAPSPRADRRTLIRRVTFDVTGLPPTPAEVDEFVRNDSPDAYERLVDRLLASPRHGEHWGRHWLDVARYSDTKGYVYAREERKWVHAWAYRDWVIRALNEDMPYDRFLLLQIAADQVSDEQAQQAALGFLTVGRRFLGVWRDIVDDRIDVVTRGTMGLSVGCARCHDHKYDPIPTRDYYSLAGVFQSCEERVIRIDGTRRDEAFESELANRQAASAEKTAARRDEAAARVRGRIADYLVAQLELEKYPEEGFDVVITEADMPSAFVRRWRDYLERAANRDDPVFSAWHALAELPPESFAAEASRACREWPSSGAMNERVSHALNPPPASMRETAVRYGKVFAEVENEWQAALASAEEINQPAPAALDDPASEQIRQVLYGPDSPCEVPHEGIVHTEFFFPTHICDELWKFQGEVDRWLLQSPVAPACALVLVDRAEPTTPRVLRRGNPRTPGEAVPRQFLGLLTGADRMPFTKGSGRLELARAIVDARNPLTARVIVNRVWLHHFGRGLVSTPSDFGTRASPPSHPELLDWLASKFVAQNWSLKWLHRQILLASTYQQASSGPSDPKAANRAREADPEVRLLWRMRPKRLQFEQLWDAALVATDDLDITAGGPPSELFAAPFPRRRAVYGVVDRQFFPATLRVFDFANPNLHIPERGETTVPQQALFFLNHPFFIERARALAAKTDHGALADAASRVREMYRRLYQREPTEDQVAAAIALVSTASESSTKVESASTADDGQSAGKATAPLGPWEQLAQVLLAANEFVFID